MIIAPGDNDPTEMIMRGSRTVFQGETLVDTIVTEWYESWQRCEERRQRLQHEDIRVVYCVGFD